ncbi:MAG: GNAT family protein [Ornithinimicrobium sp.]
MTVLSGSTVTLRPTISDDVAVLADIRATPEVHRRWRGEDLDAGIAADLADDDRHLYTVQTAASGEVIGLIQYSEESDPDYRHATVDVFLDPRVHGRGFGADTVRTLVRHLVYELGHHRVTIDPAADNEAAIACYAKVGFRPVGVMRQYERTPDGSWADGLLMDLLASDAELGP